MSPLHLLKVVHHLHHICRSFSSTTPSWVTRDVRVLIGVRQIIQGAAISGQAARKDPAITIEIVDSTIEALTYLLEDFVTTLHDHVQAVVNLAF